MKRKSMAQLQDVTKAVFQKEHQALRPVLEAEARIQHQLSRLDAQVQQSRQDMAEAEGYRITGTDVLWNGWESTTRRQLNMELARARAQKLAALDALKGAFGRKEAITSLSEAMSKARLDALRKKQKE